MATFSDNKEFWREFMELYRELPALWKVKSEMYKNRNVKNVGYEFLVEKMKTLIPRADREMATKKIDALHTRINLVIIDFHVKWVPSHDGMTRPQVSDGGGCLQIWRLAANILN
jgi:hypothetical protein